MNQKAIDRLNQLFRGSIAFEFDPAKPHELGIWTIVSPGTSHEARVQASLFFTAETLQVVQECTTYTSVATAATDEPYIPAGKYVDEDLDYGAVLRSKPRVENTIYKSLEPGDYFYFDRDPDYAIYLKTVNGLVKLDDPFQASARRSLFDHARVYKLTSPVVTSFAVLDLLEAAEEIVAMMDETPMDVGEESDRVFSYREMARLTQAVMAVREQMRARDEAKR